MEVDDHGVISLTRLYIIRLLEYDNIGQLLFLIYAYNYDDLTNNVIKTV
jgi:hypothetical protein